ncbi:MAG: sugar phosphate isomerase/epimerase [Acetobacterium sp.]|uniref:sugar phosphate isomerase/epimerase family protein n=1 Tax=Acetobacterium sp. TaxID=1872094 RepID=UPI00324261AF
MIEKIFISTGSFGKIDVDELLRTTLNNGLTNIELSSGAFYHEKMKKDLLQAKNSETHRFLVHNYFPVPEKPFVLNLASENKDILSLSRKHCQAAMQLTAELGVEFYSVHAGFCFHAQPEDLGKNQRKLERFPKAIGYNIFLESLYMLSKIGKEYGLKIAVENNVVTMDNRNSDNNNENDLYLCATGEDLQSLMADLDDQSIKLLIDLGHLSVTANSMGFDPIGFIEMVAADVIAFHISDNDGLNDRNLPVTETSWFWPSLKQFSNNAYFILEAYNLTTETIKQQCQLIGAGIYE